MGVIIVQFHLEFLNSLLEQTDLALLTEGDGDQKRFNRCRFVLDPADVGEVLRVNPHLTPVVLELVTEGSLERFPVVLESAKPVAVGRFARPIAYATPLTASGVTTVVYAGLRFFRMCAQNASVVWNQPSPSG